MMEGDQGDRFLGEVGTDMSRLCCCSPESLSIPLLSASLALDRIGQGGFNLTKAWPAKGALESPGGTSLAADLVAGTLRTPWPQL